MNITAASKGKKNDSTMYKLKEKLLPFQLCLIFNQIAVAFEEVSNA